MLTSAFNIVGWLYIKTLIESGEFVYKYMQKLDPK